jgi:glycine betaine/proline transport system permease protein
MEYFLNFPSLGRETLRDFKKGVDSSFKEFSRSHGEGIESFFEPLLQFLVFFEKLLINSPWPLTILLIAFLTWKASQKLSLVIGTVLSFIIIGLFGMWEDTMSTLAIISVATLLCLIIGTPIGIN